MYQSISVSVHTYSSVSVHKYISCFCSLPTPMTISSGESSMFPLVVRQPGSPSIWPAVQSRGLSTTPGVIMGCVCGCNWRDDACRVFKYYRGDLVVMNVILCRLFVNMILAKGDLFVLSRARVHQVSLQSC